ncbi:MAG: universal stress protein [Desulfuromonadaceae bacterium]|nr:universal stress protein [Desulfuromonadaceae bacterium]
MKNFKTILFATDFSECSAKAFEYAYALCKAAGARLEIIHTISEPVDLRGFYVPHVSFDALSKEIEASAKKMLEEFCAENLTEADNYGTLVISGVPHEEIIQQAKNVGADIIVMGTHGRSGLDHVLFGSTTEKVIRKSAIPILSVPLRK